ncbi:ABC1 family-domain-containing protein [Ochromonadaceae sp. CCMP2298]|nr:ABC1 family-domain-containing protein [Ochromonadaceae sp. CCMP2298]
MPLDPNVDNLSGLERLGRALSFYSAAVPVFASYKGEELSDTYVEERFDELHEWGSEVITEKIKDLKGFYVKTGQIISTRVDIFPPQYTSKLAITQDKLDPIPAHIIKDVVRRELLQGAPLDELFLEFDDIPLGSASIAQVHRAKLLDGRVVAVKVQRPGIKGKLLGDIANLKTFAKIIGESLLIDYYKIFVEMEKTLQFELDFLFEAQATAKVAAAVAHSPSNKPQTPSVTVPLAIPGLVSTRVMVMEYVDGVALSQMAKEMSDRGVVSGSPESLLLGRKLLSSLTDAYASMIFGSGIIHGDPHPGNIFILDGGEVALLDCGQVKQISTAQRTSLARLIILVNDWEAELGLLTTALADSVKSFGVFFKEGAGDECAAAVAILLFGSTDTILPGGYAGEEVSMDSPIVQVSEFPSEFILLGRATVMIKGIANRLGLTWGLSDRWAK